MDYLFGERLIALDLCTEVGALCGKMLAQLGIEVVKVEPPGGDTERNYDSAEPAVDLTWLALNTGKKSVTIDLTNERGRDLFLRLVDQASFIIESFPPGYLNQIGLGYDVLSKRNPRLIVTSISPFGASGPYAAFKSTDLTLLAMGGLMNQNGESDRPPLRFSVPQTGALAGAQAAAATLIAHESRAVTGTGQHIDLSVQESILAADYMEQQIWDILRENPKRMGSFQDRAGIAMRLIFPCTDGFVSWRLMFGAHGYMTGAVVGWMTEEGESCGLEDVDWESLDIRTLSQPDIERFENAIGAFFARRTKRILYSGSIERGIVLFPLSNPSDLFADDQLAFRKFWLKVNQPLIDRDVDVPDLPFLIDGARYASAVAGAPAVGEHNREIFNDVGLLADEIHDLEQAGVI